MRTEDFTLEYFSNLSIGSLIILSDEETIDKSVKIADVFGPVTFTIVSKKNIDIIDMKGFLFELERNDFVKYLFVSCTPEKDNSGKEHYQIELSLMDEISLPFSSLVDSILQSEDNFIFDIFHDSTIDFRDCFFYNSVDLGSEDIEFECVCSTNIATTDSYYRGIKSDMLFAIYEPVDRNQTNKDILAIVYDEYQKENSDSGWVNSIVKSAHLRLFLMNEIKQFDIDCI